MRLRVVSRGEPVYHRNDDDSNHTLDDTADGDDNQEEEEVITKEIVVHEQEEKEDDGDHDWTLAQFSQSNSTNTNNKASTTPPPSKGLGNKFNEVKMKDPNINLPLLLTKRKRKPSIKYNVLANLSRKLVSRKKEKATINGPNSPAQVKTPTVIRAEEVQLSLGSEFPSFVKVLVRSHVSSCYWMGLPTPFGKLHLPRNDATVSVEDESGEQTEIKYIAEKTGLSAGWRKFAVGHRLLEGDVLIFQLVEPTKFKVYIIRANDLTEVDGALSLLNLDAHTKQVETDNDKTSSKPLKIKKRKRPNSLPLTVVEKKNRRTGISTSVCQLGQLMESGNDSEEVGSEVLEGSKFSGASVLFKDVNSFEDFHIVVNGFCLDSELPEHIRMKYYELCCSKNAFLHNQFLPGLYSKLIAGIIGETVNIADAIKGSKLTTPRDEFAVWEKSLKSFELLGMNVGFLRNRLRSLRSLAFEAGGALDVKRYEEAKSGRTHTEDEIRNLEAKLAELKEASVKFDADIQTLRSKAEKCEYEFQEEVDAPW